MSLADLLQWADAHRSRALVTVERPDHDPTWLMVDDRQVVFGAAPPRRGRLPADGTPDAPGPGLKAATLEALLDVFLSSEGRFTLRNDAPTPPRAVPLDTPVQFLLMEGLRLLDEWPRVARAYPDDAARLGATDAPPATLGPLDRAILEVAQEAPALGEARLVLGVSRPCLLRRVDRLRARGLVDVEGTAHGPDVDARLLEQARLLLREAQYAEAAHVLRSMLSSNPGDRRVKSLLQEAERRQVDALLARFRPTDIVTRVEVEPERIRPTERAVLDQLDRPRPVAVLILVSPLRELETLLSLARLADRDLVLVESAE